jgi:hypothetical protein
MKTYGGVKLIVLSLLTSALDGGEWSASRLGFFTPAEIAPGAYWIGGWVGFRADRNAVGSVLPIVQTFVSIFYATLIVAFEFLRIKPFSMSLCIFLYKNIHTV